VHCINFTRVQVHPKLILLIFLILKFIGIICNCFKQMLQVHHVIFSLEFHIFN